MQILQSFRLPLLTLAGMCFLLFTSCNTENTTAKANTPASKPAASNTNPGIKAQEHRGLIVKPVNYPGRTFMAVRKRVPFSDIQPFYRQNLGKIFTACQAEGLAMDGMPSGLFYDYDEEAGQTDMAAAIGVQSGKNLGGDIQVVTIPPGKALQIDYYGKYKGIADAHYAMDDYLGSNKLKRNRALPTIEEYVTDPSSQPDPSKWLTRLVYFYE